MFCKKCGTEVIDGNYCPNCGERLVEKQSAPSFDSTTMKDGVGGKGTGSKARMIVGLIVIPFLILSVCFTVFIAIKMIEIHKKNKAINKVENIYYDARKVILDCWVGYTHTSVTKEDSVYTTTITSLIDEGIIKETPFEGAGSDGGMTVTFNSASHSWTCTTNGTVDGYKIIYDGHFFKAQ